MFETLADARGLVLAVSGGADSTALLHLAAAWRPRHLPIHVATVDHGLRAAARHEAEAVVAVAATLKLPAVILTWTGDKPATRLQERARAARYALLCGHARHVGASHVVTAHTLDDQAETLLMRIAAGSGPRGLAGMRTLAHHGDLWLARPLLAIRKAALVALCHERGWRFIEDPSNHDPRFARVRWRRLAASLEAEGLSAERLGALAARFTRADLALEAVTTDVIASCGSHGPGGGRCLAAPLFDQPDEIVLRVLDATFHGIAPSAPARLNKLEALLGALRLAREAAQPLRRTLQGCIVQLDDSGHLTILAEEPRRSLEVLLNAKR